MCALTHTCVIALSFAARVRVQMESGLFERLLRQTTLTASDVHNVYQSAAEAPLEYFLRKGGGGARTGGLVGLPLPLTHSHSHSQSISVSLFLTHTPLVIVFVTELSLSLSLRPLSVASAADLVLKARVDSAAAGGANGLHNRLLQLLDVLECFNELLPRFAALLAPVRARTHGRRRRGRSGARAPRRRRA